MGTIDQTGHGQRDTNQLRRMLERIDEEGWDGPTATGLLTFGGSSRFVVNTV